MAKGLMAGRGGVQIWGGVYEGCGIASDTHTKEYKEQRRAEGINQALGRKSSSMEKTGKMG